MKHPALARVFSVILAVLCLISVLCGMKGFKDTDKDYAKASAAANRLEKVKNTYLETDAQLADRMSYDEIKAKLEAEREKHDSDASDHRTDVATYSATKGGYTMGADALWEAKAQLAGSKQQIAEAKVKLAQVEIMKENLAPVIPQCEAAANTTAETAAYVDGYAAKLAPLLQSPPKPVQPELEMPVLPEAPTEVQEPTAPQNPNDMPPVADPGEPPTAPAEEESDENKDEWDSYRAALAKHEEDLAAYNEREAYIASYPALCEQYDKELAAYSDYLTALDEYNNTTLPEYQAQLQAYEEAMNAYQGAYGMWKMQCMMALYTMDFTRVMGAMQQGGAALQSAMAAIPPEMQGMLGGASGGAAAGGGMGSGAMPAVMSMTPEELYATLNATSDGLKQMSGGLNAIVHIDDTMSSTIRSMASSGGMNLPEGASAQDIINMLDETMKKGEWQIQDALENIWYEMGQLEEDKEELADGKSRLDGEAEELEKLQAEADEIKELENKRRSARITLTRVEEIGTAYEAGTALDTATDSYIAAARENNEIARKNGVLMSKIAIAAAICGLLGIPAAFEKLKSRFMLIIPPLLCLGGAVIAMLMSLDVSDAMHYATMMTAIFAAVHLLVVLPKQKVIK